MCVHAPPICLAFADDHPQAYLNRVPTAFTCNCGCQSSFLVGRAHQLADIDDLCLELDDQQCPRRAVPREDVDYAALAPNVERHLWRDLPTVQCFEESRH